MQNNKKREAASKLSPVFAVSCQIGQNGVPEVFLLPQGVEAAVQIHFVCRCKDRAAQKQLFICGIHGKVADLPGAAEYKRQAVLHLVAEVVVSCPGGTVRPLHFEQGVDVFHRKNGFGDCNVHQGCDLIAGILLAHRVGQNALFDVVAYHGRSELHAAEGAEIAVDILHGLVKVKPHLREIGVPGQGKPGGAGRNAAFGFSFHIVSSFLRLAQLGCAGYRKWFYGGIIAQICSLVNGFLKLLKECIKSLDRFLKNCYDVCSEPKKSCRQKCV